MYTNVSFSSSIFQMSRNVQTTKFGPFIFLEVHTRPRSSGGICGWTLSLKVFSVKTGTSSVFSCLYHLCKPAEM